MTQQRLKTQVLVIGAGISGSTSALTLADAGYEVTLIVPGKELDGGNSALAQGGIVYRSDPNDAKDLEKDILIAGHHHNYVKAVRHLCQHGPEAVERILMERAPIPFDRLDGKLDFTREGGHGKHRIVHCADHTGKTIMEGLLQAVRMSPNIRILTGRTAVDLITTDHHARYKEYRYQLDNQCLGAYVYNEDTREVETLLADFTVLATGGVGQVYLHTTNTAACTGSGIAMAQRAGVRLDNLEYVQFHPTALYTRQSHSFLITEAMRGEGARLTNAKGEFFMKRYDERADLAPRDIVARAIMDEMLHSGEPCMYLDVSGVKHDIPTRFPTIYQHCMELGIDINKKPIPVVPVAHFFCGGILVDASARTTLTRLYSVGECSCTGLHGANRLASTSLLEALLWGYSAGQGAGFIDIAAENGHGADAEAEGEEGLPHGGGDGGPEPPCQLFGIGHEVEADARFAPRQGDGTDHQRDHEGEQADHHEFHHALDAPAQAHAAHGKTEDHRYAHPEAG